VRPLGGHPRAPAFARADGTPGHGARPACHHGEVNAAGCDGGTTSGHDSQDAGGPGPSDDGTEPDARFTLANERTFLAWNRTALALVVAGLGIVQLLPPFAGVPWGRHVIGVPLIVLGAVVSVVAYWEWQRNQAALRRNEPLPRSVLPRVITAAITGIAILSAAILLISATG